MSARRSSSSHQQLQPSAKKEKQRRDRMKELYSTLAALLHLQPSERMPLPELLDRATTSLEGLKERVEELKGRKKEVEKELVESSGSSERRLQQQMVQVRESSAAEDLELEANLIIMADNKKLVPFEVLRVIEEGGAEVTSSSFSTVGDLIYCTVHAQAFQARVGFDAAQIQSQLLKLIY